MSEDYLDQKRIEIEKHILSDNPKEILNVYIAVKEHFDDPIIFYDFVGNTFVNNHIFFLTKFFKIYNKKITNLLNSEELFKMEQHILQIYCFYPNERLIISFNGEFRLGVGRHVGRIYITNNRIIVQGSIKSKGVPMVTRSIAQGAMNKHMHRKLLTKSQLTEFPCFGYQLSIYGYNNVKLKGKQVDLKIMFGKIQIRAYGNDGFGIAKVVYDTILEANNITN